MKDDTHHRHLPSDRDPSLLERLDALTRRLGELTEKMRQQRAIIACHESSIGAMATRLARLEQQQGGSSRAVGDFRFERQLGDYCPSVVTDTERTDGEQHTR